jgi:hypothetical protein
MWCFDIGEYPTEVGAGILEHISLSNVTNNVTFPPPSLGLGLLHKIRLNFVEASQ